MKPYRTILTVLYTAALTSAWWAAILYGAQIPELVAPAVFLTAGGIIFLIVAAINEP